MMSLWMGMGLVAIWLSLTVTLLGGMWVLPVRAVALPRVKRPWLWRYLRGDMGIWGTLRAGMFVAGAGWWYQVAGFSLSQDAQDIAVLLLGATLLVAVFNAGHARALPSGKSALLCGALALGWQGWWGVLLNALYRC
ncbi:hypothetical protein ACTVKH_18730 [Serratia marcescens]|uniref:hypothetical protein n=1 Tax=Serratia marcescens TaxID=615 RepID=UPI003FA6BFD9